MHVDIGGRRLYLEVAGSDSPTLILEPGIFGDSRAWQDVFGPLSDITRTVRWDRAGFGRSDLGPLPQTSERICSDLRALLHRAEIPPPYVVIGHSFGAFTLRVFAPRSADEVAGLVFVEPSMPDFDEKVRPLLTPEQWHEMQTTWRPVMHPQLVDFEQSAAQVLASPSLPDVPVLVLIAGRFKVPAGWPRDAVDALWRQSAGALARPSSTRSKVVVVEEAGHDLFVDAPTRFLDEVRAFLDLLRSAPADSS